MQLNEKTGLYENYGAWHLPFWQTYNFKIAIGICTALAILLMCAWIVKKYREYRRRKTLPIWDHALLLLASLRKENKVSIQYGKEFYVTISSLLKKYLSDRFAYNLIGTTDTEAIEYLKKQRFDEPLLQEISILLQGGEIIKFANAQAAQATIEQDYVRIVTIIQRTMPEKSNHF